MSRCFISYKHVPPDQDLAHAISGSLAQNGHGVFLDSKIAVGTRWVDEIERELRGADFFVVLLSEHSIRSDMVRQEVALAHQLASDNKLCIMPIRVAYTATLPYDLAAYLNPFQHCLWNAGESFEHICRQIETSIHCRSNTTPTAHHFEAESLARLAKELAIYVGPVAKAVVSRAARKARTWKELYKAVAEEVPADQRKRFWATRIHD